MLHEPASSPQFVPTLLKFEDDIPTTQTEPSVSPMRELIEPYMAIANEAEIDLEDMPSEDQAIIMRADSELLISYAGYLKQEPQQTFDAITTQLKEYDRYILLREDHNSSTAPHIIHVIQGRVPIIEQSGVWVNIVLFALTIVSVLVTGAQSALVELGLLDMSNFPPLAEYFTLVFTNAWRGYPYALSLMAILIAHEMGHYLMMRRHGLASSLPYFIPAGFISPFGTFGATIMLRDVLKNRKTLLDVGAAGPIAGFIVAVPIVIYGLYTSEIIPLVAGSTLEGNSLFYLFAKIVATGQIYPTETHDIFLNQVAFAGWTGLLVTTLNMIPLGQLDGGHIMYSLFGDRARWAFFPVMLSLVGISIFTGQMTWTFFLFLLLLVGRFYAVPLDAVTPLDQPRRVVAFIALAIFVVTFVPTISYTFEGTAMQNTGVMIIVALLTIPRLWRLRRK